MARQKKDNHPITIRMEKSIYDKLEAFSKETGQPKTVAIERALSIYIADYDNKKHILAEQY